MIENQRELMKQENERRKAEALKKRNSLKLHKIAMEHKKTLERLYVYVLGFDLEKDLQEWKVAAFREHGNKFNNWAEMEYETYCPQINFVPETVRKKLVYEWLPGLSDAEQKEISEYLNKENKKKK